MTTTGGIVGLAKEIIDTIMYCLTLFFCCLQLFAKFVYSSHFPDEFPSLISAMIHELAELLKAHAEVRRHVDDDDGIEKADQSVRFFKPDLENTVGSN